MSSKQVEPPEGVLLPLTVSQRGMWVGHKIGGRGVVFNLAEAVEIHGPVDATLFVAALQRLTTEAQAVRVRIVEDQSGPRQWLRARFDEGFRIVDLEHRSRPVGRRARAHAP